MKKISKLVDALGIADLEKHPIWEFPTAGECIVRPVRDLPVNTLTFRIVGTQVRLANGDLVWADVGNIIVKDWRKTSHFLTLTIYNRDKRFVLARYFDFDFDTRGPEALASFLGLTVDEVFPITYDITRHVIGDLAALRGTKTKEPREKRTEKEIIALALEMD